MPGAFSVLIVKLSALGDVLRTTSLLLPLVRRHPRCRIAWLASPGALPLLAGNPWVSELRTPGGPGPPLDGRFDLVLSLEEDPAAARTAERACRGELIGVVARGNGLSYTPSSARYYDMSLLNRSADGGLEKANALKAANRLTYAELWLKVLGLPIPKDKEQLRPVLVLSAEERAEAQAIALGAGLERRPAPIGLNPGAGRRWPAKQLSVAGAARLAVALRRRLGRPVLLFGGKDEAARNKAIAAAAARAGAPLIPAGTGRSLRSFAALVGLCEAVVTADTLALHVAAALGLKVFPLVGPTSAAELDVFGRGEKILPARACSCFYRPRCRFATGCLDRIPARRIADAVARWVS